MLVKKIRIHNFRNFGRVDLELGSKINFFVGPNGQGKTNFLEGLLLLTTGESFRPGTKEVFLKIMSDGKHAEAARIAGELSSKNLEFAVQVDLDEKGKRKTFVNGKRATGENLRKLFPAILFSPESLSAIKGGPDLRRQMVDDLVIGTMSKGQQLVTHFRRALLQRNKVLRWLRDGEKDTTSLLGTLETLNDQFLPLAAEMVISRISAMHDIEPMINEILPQVLGQESARVRLDYLITAQSARDWDENSVVDQIRKRMTELRDAELAAGTSLVGPQRHDISFLFCGQDSRYFCSQGQQRALILSYKMAQIMYHQKIHQEQPLLLLDDVMSELDATKQELLVSYLRNIDAQIVITTTDYAYPQEFSDLKINTFNVENGVISRG